MILEKSCGAAIYTGTPGGPRYLIEYMRLGHVSLCKGHTEDGETERQTAAREIAEETGLSVTFQDGFRETIAYSPYDGCQKTVVFFLARADTTAVTPQESEVASIAWLPLPEAIRALTYDGDREILRKADAFLRRREGGGTPC